MKQQIRKVTALTVANVGSKDAAQKFFDAINGKTYMNFQIKFAPAYGSFDVIAETDYPATKKEINSMLLSVMFDAIRCPEAYK